MSNVVSFDTERTARYVTQALHGFYGDQPDSDFQRGYLAALLWLYREACEKPDNDMILHLERMTSIGNIECERMEPDEEGWSEWIHPTPGYLMQCCDCDLVHNMEFQIVPRDAENDPTKLNPGESDDAVIIFRARRHP